MVPLPDDDELRAHTEALIDVPPDIVIATTGIGFRGWVAAADGWGLANELLAALGKARIVSRGPKATGALRAAGLPEEWSPESESSRELLHYLSRVASPASASRCSCTAPPTTGIRSPSSSTSCVPQAPRWCRSACTAGTPRLATVISTTGGGHRRREVRRGQLHLGARGRVGADARHGDGHRGPGAVGAAHRRTRDVRRAR